MKSTMAMLSGRFIASTALLCIFAASAATAAPSKGISSTSRFNAVSNPYAVAGGQFLWEIQEEFLQENAPSGFNLRLYANSIDPDDRTQSLQVPYMWTQDQMIRALYWGAQVDDHPRVRLHRHAQIQFERYQWGWRRRS